MFRRTIEICALLAVLAGVAALPAPAGATPPCPVEYCTDSTGNYELVVPPLTNLPIVGNAYADCIWHVHADFGDGTSEELIFDASVGLTGSHAFPTRGVTYTVKIQLTNGHHGNTEEPCTNFTKEAKVRYRTASEEEDEAPDPWELIEQKEIVPEPIPLAPTIYTPNPFVGPTSPTTPPVAFWRQCRAGVRAHGVSCRKGRQVIGRAREKLRSRAGAPVAGFSCRATAVAVVCRRGTDRVLAPRVS